ncbi:hypothetical protein RMCBS344292_00763 [Rhizopus microsporus]|nr:hypothetical protein RMCBS344292_00763 [Rhizopus microsporus]
MINVLIEHSHRVGYMKNIDLASESAIKTLKEHVTEEDYNDIDSSLKTEEMKLSQSANELIKAIGSIKRPALHAPENRLNNVKTNLLKVVFVYRTDNIKLG